MVISLINMMISLIDMNFTGNGCMVEYCADIYSERLDEGGIFIGMNAPYCQVI